MEKKSNGLAVTSLILGIVSLVFSFIPVLGQILCWLLGLAAIGLGIPAAVKKQSMGMWLTGFITAGVSLIIAYFIWV